jgi:hypothetical protein
MATAKFMRLIWYFAEDFSTGPQLFNHFVWGDIGMTREQSLAIEAYTSHAGLQR